MPVEQQIIQHHVSLDIFAWVTLRQSYVPLEDILQLAQYLSVDSVMVDMSVFLDQLSNTGELLQAALGLLPSSVLQEQRGNTTRALLVLHVTQFGKEGQEGVI